MVNATVTPVSGDGSVALYSYVLTTANGVGSEFQEAPWADRSVQVNGTWGGASLVLEGSNDGVTYEILRDPSSLPLLFTSNGLKQILEVAMYIRPRLSVAGSGANLNVSIVVHRPTPMRT